MKLNSTQFLTKTTVQRHNPATQGAKSLETLRAGDSIPEGKSITGITYQNNADGSHAGTLLHVRPEVQQQSLATRAWRDRD